MSMRINEIKGQIRLVTGLHIGAGNDDVHIGGIDTAVVKTPDGFPYIPGSSIKGKIRSLLELSEGVSSDKPINRKSNPDSLIPIVFGDLTKTEITRVIFRDAFLSDKTKKQLLDDNMMATEEKSENSINRITGVADNPRKIERVIPGLAFDFEVNLRVFDGDDAEDFKKLLSKGLYLLEHDALGGNGSRGYGKVCFENLTFDGKPFSVEL